MFAIGVTRVLLPLPLCIQAVFPGTPVPDRLVCDGIPCLICSFMCSWPQFACWFGFHGLCCLTVHRPLLWLNIVGMIKHCRHCRPLLWLNIVWEQCLIVCPQPTQSGRWGELMAELTGEAAERVYRESVSSHPVTQSRGTGKHEENDDSVRNRWSQVNKR